MIKPDFPLITELLQCCRNIDIDQVMDPSPDGGVLRRNKSLQGLRVLSHAVEGGQHPPGVQDRAATGSEQITFSDHSTTSDLQVEILTSAYCKVDHPGVFIDTGILSSHDLAIISANTAFLTN